MSMLSGQADELRKIADKLRSVKLADNESDCGTLFAAMGAMREAADTIDSMRDWLQEENDALRDYRASQITVEAERRMQESYGQVPEQVKREDEGEHESYSEDNSCAQCAEGMGCYADSLCDPLKQRIAELEGQRDALLRCLENDYGIRASWDGLRRVWLTESVNAELDYVEDKSRWAHLFGTPEKAARTLADNCDDYNLCDGCSADCKSHDCYDALLEWLRGDAE